MIRKATAMLALVIGFAAPAWADSVHIGDTTNVTNKGGQGGQGGAGGTGVGVGIGIGKGGDGGNAYATGGAAVGVGHVEQNVKQDVDVTNVNVNEATQGQAQGQKQKQGQGQGQKQATSTTVSIEGDRVEVPASAPSVFGGSLVASPETCLGSFQAGGSGSNGLIGFGLNFGKTYVDPDCTRRMYARSLMLLGGQYNVAAIALLAQDENVAKALRDAGLTVPGQQSKAVDTTIPDLKLDTPLGEKKSESSTNFGTRASMTIPEALIANLAAQSAGAGM